MASEEEGYRRSVSSSAFQNICFVFSFLPPRLGCLLPREVKLSLFRDLSVMLQFTEQK